MHDNDRVRQGILASSRQPLKGHPTVWSLQGRISKEKKCFVLSSFRRSLGSSKQGKCTYLFLRCYARTDWLVLHVSHHYGRDGKKASR